MQKIAANNGITFDTVSTGRYADIFSIARPRTPGEMAVLQRGTDAVYAAFIDRVSTARQLTPDSVRAIAEGRVWSGTDAMRIGLVDSIGGLDAAVKSAASLARLSGDYDVREYPRARSTTDVLKDLFERKPQPVASLGAQVAGSALLAGPGRAQQLARDVIAELGTLLSYNDPRGVYARLPYILTVR